MQTEQLVLQRLDTISAQLDQIARRQQAFDELLEEMTPIAREMLAATIARLDTFEKQGYFALARELVAVAGRVSEGLASAVRDADHVKPMGAFRALRATRDDDVQKGLGLLVDVLRRIGHAVHSDGSGEEPRDQRAKLAQLLGPWRQRLLPAAHAPARSAVPATVVAPPPQRSVDPTTWTRELGVEIAREQGITLDTPRWALIDAARADFATTKASPNIQRLTSVAGVSTKDLYQLFPKAPARTIAKIAGLPKPAGCL